MRRSYRGVFDTNIWISFLITGDFKAIDELVFSRKITILYGEELIKEFIATSQRPKLSKYFNRTRLQSILNFIEHYGENIEVNSTLNLCRDKKDNFLLELVQDGDADFLITGDKDLPVIEKIGKTEIIRISDFLNRGI